MKNLNSTIMMVATLLVSSAEASSVKDKVTSFVRKNGAVLVGGAALSIAGAAFLVKQNIASKKALQELQEKANQQKLDDARLASLEKKTEEKTAKKVNFISRSASWIKHNPGKTAVLGIATAGIVAAGILGKQQYDAYLLKESTQLPTPQEFNNPVAAPKGSEASEVQAPEPTPEAETIVSLPAPQEPVVNQTEPEPLVNLTAATSAQTTSAWSARNVAVVTGNGLFSVASYPVKCIYYDVKDAAYLARDSVYLSAKLSLQAFVVLSGLALIHKRRNKRR